MLLKAIQQQCLVLFTRDNRFLVQDLPRALSTLRGFAANPRPVSDVDPSTLFTSPLQKKAEEELLKMVEKDKDPKQSDDAVVGKKASIPKCDMQIGSLPYD
jgi:hypothetical protein